MTYKSVCNPTYKPACNKPVYKICTIPQRYSNNCPGEIIPHACKIKNTCVNPYRPQCCKPPPVCIPCEPCCSSSESDCYTSESYYCSSSESDSDCCANLEDDNEMCLCIDFSGKTGQGCLNDIFTDEFCEGDFCLLLDTGVLLAWCAYDNAWKFCSPQPEETYYYYDSHNYKIWIVDEFGDAAEEFTVDNENFTIYDNCNNETYHKVGDKWILGYDRL